MPSYYSHPLVLVENYISPGRRSASHNNPDRAPLMSHNGPASMRNRRWWPRTRFLSTPCLSSTHTLFVHPFFFLSNKTYARGFFHFSFSFNSRIFLFVLLLFSCCFFFFSAGLLRRYKHTRMHTLCEMVMGPCHLISSDYFYTRSRARS